MVAVLCDKSAVGMSAIYADSGIQVARAQTSDLFVVPQNDLDVCLRMLFRLSEVSTAADIATSFRPAGEERPSPSGFWQCVRQRRWQRQREVKDILKALARGSSKFGHQVVFTMQNKEAAESIADLNGDTTYKSGLQDESFGAYRWTKNETGQLIQRLSDGQQDANQILAHSEIPDEIGRWRPRFTELFIRFGRKPSAPLRKKQAGQALKGLESPTCTCSLLRKSFGSDSFKRTASSESCI